MYEAMHTGMTAAIRLFIIGQSFYCLTLLVKDDVTPLIVIIVLLCFIINYNHHGDGLILFLVKFNRHHCVL